MRNDNAVTIIRAHVAQSRAPPARWRSLRHCRHLRNHAPKTPGTRDECHSECMHMQYICAHSLCGHVLCIRMQPSASLPATKRIRTRHACASRVHKLVCMINCMFSTSACTCTCRCRWSIRIRLQWCTLKCGRGSLSFSPACPSRRLRFSNSSCRYEHCCTLDRRVPVHAH